MIPRWFCILALVIAFAALYLVPPPNLDQQIALLERLARKIERAQTLSPEARDTFLRLVDAARARPVNGSSGQLHEVRRTLAIERVANAITAKQNAFEAATTSGQR
jgi:hypothetical protein